MRGPRVLTHQRQLALEADILKHLSALEMPLTVSQRVRRLRNAARTRRTRGGSTAGVSRKPRDRHPNPGFSASAELTLGWTLSLTGTAAQRFPSNGQFPVQSKGRGQRSAFQSIPVLFRLHRIVNRPSCILSPVSLQLSRHSQLPSLFLPLPSLPSDVTPASPSSISELQRLSFG